MLPTTRAGIAVTPVIYLPSIAYFLSRCPCAYLSFIERATMIIFTNYIYLLSIAVPSITRILSLSLQATNAASMKFVGSLHYRVTARDSRYGH